MIISISDLKINNQPYAGIAIKITDPYPTINWSYGLINRVILDSSGSGTIDGIITTSVAGYEIRIGASLAELGTNSFYGSIYESGFVVSQNTSYRYGGYSLLRGNTYYGQIQITDALGNSSGWATFTFQYNSIPAASTVAISPSQPSTSDSLLLSYVFSDPDGDLESGSKIWWFRNGVHQRNLDGLTLVDSENLVYGDTWSATVFPSDGYEIGLPVSSSTITVATTTPILNTLQLLPIDPTINDPLFANYTFTGELTDKSQVKWYVNGSPVVGYTQNFARFPTNVGDTVYFEITASDGVSTGAIYSSSPIVITDAPFLVSNLIINNDQEPLDVSTLTPSVSWTVAPSNRAILFTNILIGTAAGASNVLNVTLPGQNDTYSIPAGILSKGRDYYVTVNVGDNLSKSDNQTIHFRTLGSRWNTGVSNSTGWTIETNFRINSGYQGFRIYDGVRHAELRFYTDHLTIISGQMSTFTASFSAFSTITITGQGTNISVYQNYQPIVTGIGLLLVKTTEKMIEFGSINISDASSADYLNLYYSVSGAFTPGVSTAYADMVYDTFYQIDGNIDYITSSNGQMYFAASSNDVDSSSEIYNVSDYEIPVFATTVNKTYSPINSITVNGNYTYFSHARGATVFSNYLIPAYTNLMDFTIPQKPDQNGWEIVDEIGTVSYTHYGLEINSLAGGITYFTQRLPGSQWFETVNNNGWTVEFSLAVSSLNNTRQVSNTDLPDGFGLYVNDGKQWESIYFYPTEIYFANAEVSVQCDTSKMTDYIITGNGESLQIFSRTGSLPYCQLATPSFSKSGTTEGNASNPSICEDINGSQHVVWSDDGSDYSEIYYSENINGVWTLPLNVVSTPFAANNPDICVDLLGTVYIVYEDESSDYTSIGMVVRNQYGWSDPYIITSGIYDSLYPRITIDAANNVHIAWQDAQNGQNQIFYIYRTFSSGNWSEPLVVDNGTSPSIAVNSLDIFISYTKNGNIYAAKLQSGAISNIAMVGSSFDTADASDIAVQNNFVHIVWQDVINGHDEILARKFTTSLMPSSIQVQLTSTAVGSKYPSIGTRLGTDIYSGNLYVVWEYAEKQMRGAYFDHNVGTWLSDNQTPIAGGISYGGYDVIFAFNDLRTVKRPRIPKKFSNSVNIVSQTQMAVATDEYLSTTDDFATIRNITWNLSYLNSITPSLPDDLLVSGILPRKEIRFGDFSENLGGDFVFGDFRFYTNDDVSPFTISLISTETTPIVDNRSYCTSVSANGDAWIGTKDGLSFYFYRSKEIANATTFTSTVRSVIIDNNGFMLVGTDDGNLYASYDHATFVLLTITNITSNSAITSLAVAPDNTVWMGTSTNGVYQLTTDVAIAPLANNDSPLAVASNSYTLTNGLPSLSISRIRIDNNGTVWVATDNGIVSITNSLVVFNNSNSGLPSNRVNDICIIDNGTRYIATSNGLAKMAGSVIQTIAIGDSNWNGNIKSLAFLAPNILWAGTMSYMFQISIQPDGTYTWVSYPPSFYTLSPNNFDDLTTYYIVDLDTSSISQNTLIEVYVNGRITLHGFTISQIGNNWAIQFTSPLLRSDIVTVSVRNDITKYASLSQNAAALAANGLISTKVEKFITNGTALYAATAGSSPSLIQLNYADAYMRPYGKIGLDTTPPFGTLTLVSQVDRQTASMAITNYGDNLSGLVSMRVSNYANFTSDGVTPLPWIPFSPTFNFNLGTDLGLSSVQLQFSEGIGSVITQFTAANSTSVLFAGASLPARIYSYSATTEQWSQIATLDVDINNNPNPNTSIHFMIVYNSALFIGTGTPGGTGKIFTSSDGENFSLFASISGDTAYCATIFNNTLYIGTGPGGNIFAYNGTSIQQVYSGLGSNIYSISGYGNNIYLATGEQGRLYQWNPITNTAIIIDVDPDTQLTSVIACFVEPPASATSSTAGDTALPTSDPSIILLTSPQATQNTTTDSSGGQTTNTGTTSTSGDNVIFFGTGNTSRIMKSDNQSPFITSFVTTTGNEVSFLKVIDSGNGGVLYAGIDQTLLYYGNKVWLTKQGVTDKIKDVYLDINGNIWIMTNSFIYMTSTNITNKTIYLQLRDLAGNETTVTAAGLQLSLQIADLQNFTNSDRILELDEYGQTVMNYDGDSPFYSADRVETETGTYISTIFNGTNEQVSWGIIYWDAVEPDGTTLQVGVRTSNSRDGVGTTDWTYYDQSQSSGVDISNYSGQYIQFSVNMTSTTRGLSPSLYKVVITSVIKASVHFFTTNFILPSPIVSGIITSQKIVPVSADIVFGIDTNNSVDFSDYQIISENRIFTAAMNQTGTNLRVGVQLISPTIAPLKTDFYPEYDAYGSPVFINVVDFSYTAATAGTKNFLVSFYNDSAMTELVTSLSTFDSVDGWSVDGAAFPEFGEIMTEGQTSNIICTIEDTGALRCNQYYYVNIQDISASTPIAINSSDVFIAGCDTSFADSIGFDFTNSGTTGAFNFRVKVYSNPERTQLVETFLSANNNIGWTCDYAILPDNGVTIATGQTVSVEFIPNVSGLTPGQIYYLSIDSYNGLLFSKISHSWTFKSSPVSAGSCGEYTNVPVLKNFVIMFELENGSYIMLNT